MGVSDLAGPVLGPAGSCLRVWPQPTEFMGVIVFLKATWRLIPGMRQIWSSFLTCFAPKYIQEMATDS